MVTDEGKPTCLKEGEQKYYKNSFGLDKKIMNKTLDQAAKCRKLGVTITTFMIARDVYLQEFVREFTKTNSGRAFYSSLSGLGDYIFEDYIRNRRKRVAVIFNNLTDFYRGAKFRDEFDIDKYTW